MMMMHFEIYICVQLRNTHSQCTHSVHTRTITGRSRSLALLLLPFFFYRYVLTVLSHLP